MTVWQGISIGIVVVMLYPFILYFKSHLQMSAWMDSYFKSIKKHNDGEKEKK
jgi:hypothetical protein